MGGKKPLRRPLWPPTRATASNYYPLGLDGAGGAAKPLLRAPKKPAPLHGRLPAFSGAVDAFERARKCFLEWRYFFSIILSEFLKNRVALQKDLVEKAGIAEKFEIASAATSAEEVGNPVYPPARQKLADHAISCVGKTARQMTRQDYDTYDYLVAMDRSNLRDMARFVGNDPLHKVSLLMSYTSTPHDVADPWFTGNFEDTWRDVLAGCTALLERLCQ